MDPTPITALLERMVAAWNAGDAAAFADVFTEDADYITFFGAHLKGRREIEAAHETLFTQALKGSRIGSSTTGSAGPTIRFLSDDVALVISRGGTVLAGESTPAPDRESIMTLTAVRHADGWRLASFQNTRIAPPPGAPAKGGRRE
ncbi:MAG TPA: SgcJ/EcaC family oxidoreductase [Actinopolymorphaceae bacterium]|jgi:uncharacterized protein (TIGR02246 family)